MDHEIRRSGLAGNYCALVVELDGVADVAEIERRCADFAARFPLATARLSRQGRQYGWVIGSNDTLPLRHIRLEAGADPVADERRALSRIINQTAPVAESPPFEVHLLESAGRSIVVLRWFHPAVDAKGAELVLHQLFGDAETPSPMPGSVAPAPLAHLLQQWGLWQKFRLGRKAVANIRALDRYSSVLPPTAPEPADQIDFKRVCFGPEQSAQILALARQQCGMTGTTLYMIGCMMRAMEATGADAGSAMDGDAYCVPYAVNLRRSRALLPLFSNQVSFLFAQAGRERLRPRRVLFEWLREQHRDAVRQGLDRAMLPLLQAGNWLSLAKYARIVRNSPSGRERSSFWFSHTGEMEPQLQSIAGCRVKGVYQFSQLTSPPGLGLLVSSFQGRLTLSFNFVGNQFEPGWIDRLAASMTDQLLDQQGAS